MASVKGIIVEIGGDTSKLQSALKKVNSSTSSLNKELKRINSLLKLDPKNTELVAQKQTVLKQNIEQTSEKLRELRKAQEMADETIKNDGKISEEEYRNLQREIINTENKLKQLKVEASNWTKAGRSIEEFGSKVGNISNKLDKIGTTLTTRLTLPIVGFATTAIASMDAVDEGLDTVAVKTGATGEAAKDLQRVYREVAAEVPGEFGDIGAAVGEINTRLDLTGDKLKTASVEFLKFAKVNGVDVNTSVQLVTRAMGDAGIKAEDYASLLDMLTVAGQKSGVSMESLTTNLAKYGAPMRALGIDTKNAIAMFAGWEKAGVNTEIAFSGMKKAISNWGAAGKDSTKEFSKTLNEIAKCPTIAKATTKAIQVFGAKAGPDLADAIKGGRFEFEEYVKALENGSGTLQSTYSQIVDEVDDTQLAMQNAKLAMHDAGEIMAKSLGPILLDLSKKSKGLMERFDKLSDKEKKQILNMGLMVASTGPAVKIFSIFGKGVGKVTSEIGVFSQAIGVVRNNTQSTVPAVNNLANVIKSLTSPVGLAITSAGALAGAYILLKHEADKLPEELQRITEETKKAKQSHEEYRSELDKTTSSNLAQIKNTQELREELGKLVDENGRVKDGYKDRVAFILNELNEAFGTEYKLTGNIIEQYKKLQDEIDLLILKKNAQIIMENEEEKHAEALNNKDKAYQKLIDSQNQYNDALKGKTYEEFFNDLKQNYIDAGYTAEKSAEHAKDWMSKWIDGYKEAYETNKGIYDDYIKDISKYENDFAIMQSNNTKQIEQMVNARIYSYGKESSTKEEQIKSGIQQELYNIQELKRMREEDLKNQNEISAQAHANSIESGKKRLESLVENLTAQTSIINENSPEVIEAWKVLASESYNSYSEAVSQMPPEMQQKIQEMTGVIAGGTPQMQAQAEELGRKTVEEFDKSADAKTKGLDTITGYLNGLSDEDKRELLKQAGIDNVDEIMEQLDRGDLSEENGKNILQGLWNGLKNGTWQGKILGVASGLAQAVNKAFTGKDGWDEHSPSKKMKKFAEYYVQPIEDVMNARKKGIISTAQGLASKINDTFNEQMDIYQIKDFGKLQGKLSSQIIDSTKTVFTTPQIVFNVQELDEAKLQQCFNYVNKKFGSAY